MKTPFVMPEPIPIVESVKAIKQEDALAMIQSQLARIDQLKKDKRTKQESLRNLMDNNKEFSAVDDERKAVAAKVKEKKNVVLRGAEAIQIIADVDEITGEINDVKESLSTNLMVYHVKTGKRDFQDAEGNERKIVFSYKVKPVQMSLFDKNEE